VLGVGVFVGMDARRAAHADTTDMIRLGAQVQTEEVQDLPGLPAPPAPPPAAPAPTPTTTSSPSPAPYVQQANVQAAAAAHEARLKAPALVVDFAPADRAPMRSAAEGGGMLVKASMQDGGDAPGGEKPEGGADAPLAVDDARFAARAAADRPDRVRAVRMSALDLTIPQGAMVEAVMETALNSDLPGFARAVVSRDVMSFDGSNILIPRGSRVIGQYKSGVALGASRVFIIWTRLIRPDGVSVQLASPATDDLGRSGITGKVNRHFFQRFGGAILLSVLNAGLTTAAAAATDGGGGVYIGSASDATNLAGQALKGSDIPPTIKTPQGANVRIFVARDLDFTGVGPST
jgi:type IV secretion system protein VirB10